LDTLSVVEKIVPRLDKFYKIKKQLRDPAFARSILAKLDRLFVLKESVEELLRRRVENAHPIVCFDGIKATKKLVVKYPLFHVSGWWGSKWDRLLTLATYRYGWGKVDSNVAEQCGFSKNYDTRGDTKPVMGRFPTYASYAQLVTQVNNLEYEPLQLPELTGVEVVYNPMLNQKSVSAKKWEWPPLDALEQRMRSITTHLRRDVKKRRDRQERFALQEKKAKDIAKEAKQKQEERERTKKQKQVESEKAKMAKLKEIFKKGPKNKKKTTAEILLKAQAQVMNSKVKKKEKQTSIKGFVK